MQHEVTGVMCLQGQNKEAIIDESAPHQRRSEITLYNQSPWRQAKRETEALLHRCAPTLSVPLVCLLDFFSRSYDCSGEAAEERRPSLLQIPEHVDAGRAWSPPRVARRAALPVWLPETETQQL